ncbi:unnamed protein product [Rotaria sordida]|uniref:Uncharacterized protein n=1 Tax=Rotaria sordida TaxID=392033 RepID=A0A818U6H4_9BILA|nr:unnamed protein product [Rotaria sordida]
MSLPRHVLQTLEIPRVTQAHVSDDYAVHLRQQDSQWTIGVSSMLADAIGLVPYKDVFWSSSIEPRAPYRVPVMEPVPDRKILIATLSTGPIASSDAINYTNIKRIIRCCSEDGTILKPDRTISMIDTLVAGWPQNNGVSQEELYSTRSTLKNQSLAKILNEQMITDNNLLPRNTSLSDIMNTWTDQMGYPYVEFLFDVEAQPPNSPYNYQWYIPFQFKSLSSSSSSSITWLNEKQINITIDANSQSNEWILANPNLLDILPLSLVFDMLNYAKLEQEYIVCECIIVGIQYIEQMLATSYSNIQIYEQWRSYLIDLIRPIYTYFDWNSQSMNEKWIDIVYRNFNHPSNNTIEINYREIVYCTNIRLGSRTLFQFLFH